MGRTIEAFEEAELRGNVKVMVGGAPLTQEFADDMGADGYGKDAISCVDIAKGFYGIGAQINSEDNQK
jgi:5-methyltetrahydrofolate--homocysteine methyltransferase